MHKFWSFILIGNNNSGKTTVQRKLIDELCSTRLGRLDSNKTYNITHADAPRFLKTIFASGRSYQEFSWRTSVEAYFDEKFDNLASIAILSSHSNGNCIDDIKTMIHQLKIRYYNVAGIFLENSANDDTANISGLNWNARYWIDNPQADDDTTIEMQLSRIAADFARISLRSSIM